MHQTTVRPRERLLLAPARALLLGILTRGSTAPERVADAVWRVRCNPGRLNLFLLEENGGGVTLFRGDCLDHLLIVGRRHLERVLAVYVRHYDEHRPHRALGLVPPEQPARVTPAVLPIQAHRRDLLGGLIHEYKAAA